METVRFHIAQISFFFLEDIAHLVVQSEQFGSHEKLSWGFMGGEISRRPIGTSC